VRHRLVVSAAAVGALVAGLAAPAVAGPAHGATATSWAVTGTRAEPTGGLRPLGALATGTSMHVSVALGLRDGTALERAIAAGRTFTPAEFDARFAPTAASVASVTRYLRSHGLTDVTTTANRVLVSADGPAATIEAAFHTTIGAFTLDRREVFANTTAAEVPAALGSTVRAVLGLNDVATMTSDLTRARVRGATTSTRGRGAATNPASSCSVAGVGYLCTYNPEGFWKAYDATSTPAATKTAVAIFAEGDLTQVVKDLRQEERANGLAQVPLTIVATGAASTDTSGADEWDLDTQYSTGMAKSVKHLYLYDAASLTDSDLAASFAKFVTQDVAKAGSVSLGECEYQAYLDGSMVADDEAFAQAAAQGQTVFASAGDTGGFCPVASTNGVPAGIPDVNYPASSPYVTSVGGTTLVTGTGGVYDEELAWVAGGGGISLFESAPAWQDGDGLTGTVLPTVCGAEGVIGCGRTVPDVAMDADPDSGANVYVSGTPEGVGGTSLASPLALGVWARLETIGANKLPYAAPVLYKDAGTAAFHDITLGDTGPYPALPGYDLATGNGTFDVAAAAKIIK
jgi:pseudomonalisin